MYQKKVFLKYPDKDWDWSYISMNRVFDEEELEILGKYLDWGYIIGNHKNILPKNFLRKMYNKYPRINNNKFSDFDVGAIIPFEWVYKNTD